MTTLFIKETHNRYRVAEPHEIMQAADTEISKHYAPGTKINHPNDAAGFLKIKLAMEQSEIFCCLFLTNNHQIISFDKMFHGTIDGASVHPREVVKRSLHYNAAAVILVHNHPSGTPEPSRADQILTTRLREALAQIDV